MRVLISIEVALATYGHGNLNDLNKRKLGTQLIAVVAFHLLNSHTYED